MKKQPIKKQRVQRPRTLAPASTLDWTPLFAAFREAFDGALDLAATLAGDFPEEVAAVTRVRNFMRARLAGNEAHVRIDDVLFTFGLVIGAIERDLGPTSVRASWFAGPTPEYWEPWAPRLPASELWLLTSAP